MKTSLILIILILCSETFANAIWGEPYLSHCDQAMSLAQKSEGHDTVEKRLLTMVKTPGQMLQLMYDYKTIFSKEFADAFLLAVGDVRETNNTPIKVVKAFHRINNLPSEKFNQFVWGLVDKMVLLQSNAKKSSEGQIAFLQNQRFVEEVKRSDKRRLFEEIAGIYVRAALAKQVENILYPVQFGSPRPEGSIVNHGRNKRRLIEASVIVPTTALAFVYLMSAINPVNTGNMGIDFFEGLFGAGIGVMAGIVRDAFIIMNDKDEDLDHFRLKPPGNQVDLRILGQNSEFIELVLDNYMTFAEGAINSGFISLNKACSERTCNLSPVQIAYLGHFEALEIETLNNNVKSAMKKVDLTSYIQELDGAARAVYDDPSSFEKQAVLEIKLKGIMKLLDDAYQTRSKAASSLIEFVDTVSDKTLNLLSKKSYNDRPETAKEIALHKLLHLKVENDVAELARLKVDSKALHVRVEQSLRAAQRLQGLVKNLPRRNFGWQIFAESILLTLDDLQR